MTDPTTPTSLLTPALHERWSARLKATRPVAVLLLLTAIVGGLAVWADAIKKFRDVFLDKPTPLPTASPTNGASGSTIQVSPIITVSPSITVGPPSQPPAPTQAAVRPQLPHPNPPRADRPIPKSADVPASPPRVEPLQRSESTSEQYPLPEGKPK